jgi:hypothetical protein
MNYTDDQLVHGIVQGRRPAPAEPTQAGHARDAAWPAAVGVPAGQAAAGRIPPSAFPTRCCWAGVVTIANSSWKFGCVTPLPMNV